MASKFRPTHAILCDDIRQEDNGKGILIGVFSGDVLLPSPGLVKMSFWIEGRLSEVGDPFIELKTELLDEGEKVYSTAMSGAIPLSTKGETNGVVTLNTFIPVEFAGYVTLSVKSGDEWPELLRKKISIVPSEP